MREIFFRAKYKGGWIHGASYTDTPFYTYVCGVKVDAWTLGEFTGLNDCKGVRAYEGDVIRILTQGETPTEPDPTLYLIEWDSPRFGAFSPGHIKTVWDWGTFEIVGNIHDDENLRKKFNK